MEIKYFQILPIDITFDFQHVLKVVLDGLIKKWKLSTIGNRR